MKPPPRTALPDPLTPEQRRLNMSRVRGKDTKPEMILRRGLHAQGLRYRLHARDLPGHPDLVFRSRRVVVFVHGCFWHGHNCALFKLPSTNSEFWEKKIQRNVQRDAETVSALLELGWRVVTVWECALRGPGRLTSDMLLHRVQDAICDTASEISVRGLRAPL